MTAETWYVGGSDVLIRAGRHLLLLGADRSQDISADFLERCWDVVTGPGDVPGRLLALVDEEYPQSGLALLDLTPGSLHRVVRGADVVDDGTTRRVRFDSAPATGPWLPFEGGIVAASAVEVRIPAATLPATGIIDGIPAELLREMADSPTSEPPEPSAASGTVTRPPVATPVDGPVDAQHTVRRAPVDPDHDGATASHRAATQGPVDPVVDPVPVATGDTVLAVLCPRGHVTSAVDPLCRACGGPVADQPPNRIPRPVLGALRLPTGELVPLDRGVLLGRRPSATGDEPAKPHLVRLPPDNSFVSRMHVRIELEGWLVVARDLGSRGGTTWKVPGRAPERMRANEPYLLEPGHALDLADSYEVVFEVTHEIDPVTGPALPGFTYLDRLGTGGFAEVFLYEQRWPRRKVAVKVVRPDVPLTDREKALFTTEANSMARLADHPYIVTVITAGVTSEAEGGRPYLVLRYCPPPDLGVRVRNAPLSVPDALATGVKLASAIETAHSAGILHRDIKPSNVLMTTYGEPALTDFGIAGRIHEVDTDREVRISYPWTSPELLDGRSNGSVASDVYSLGATIWNLLVGRSPFAQPQGDNSSRGLAVRILHAPPPLTQRSDVPPALDRLLQQCLAKDPAHRPAGALELARGLQQIESQLGFARTPIAVELPGAEPSFTPPKPDDDDATIIKPISILPDGELRSPAVPPLANGAPMPERRHGAATLIWSIAGVAVLLAVILVIVLNGGGGEDPTVTNPTSTQSHTPLPVEPAAPDPPLVSSARQGDRVLFTWKPAQSSRGSESYEWKREDTGESERTTDQRLTIQAADKVCLQVRLIRDTDTSGWTQECG